MHQFYKYLTFILLATAAVIGPVLFFVYKYSPADIPAQTPPSPQTAQIQTAIENTAPEKEPEPARILALGDIMLGRAVRTMYEKNGTDYLLSGAGNILSGKDIIWANLEGPVMESAPITPINGMKFAFATSSLGILRSAGIKYLNLANNHGLDQGRKGARETNDILTGEGLTPIGDALNLEYSGIATTTAGGKEIIFAGMNATWPSFKTDAAVELVKKVRANEKGLLLIGVHWGEEYKTKHNHFQEDLAQKLIDAGADVIIGHHPHVTQDIGIYRGKYIFYSLGNFIFDQWFSKDTQEGLAVEMDLSGENIYFRLWPYRSERSRVLEMKEEERADFLKKLSQISSPGLEAEILAGKLTGRAEE